MEGMITECSPLFHQDLNFRSFTIVKYLHPFPNQSTLKRGHQLVFFKLSLQVALRADQNDLVQELLRFVAGKVPKQDQRYYSPKMVAFM